MPELPEVETIRRQLNEVLSGKKIKEVEILRETSFTGDKNKLIGLRIKRVERKAKIIEFIFEGEKDMVICHLKMTGQLIYCDGDKRVAGGHPTADWIKKLPSSHTRVIWKFADGSELFFNDMRVFGWMRIVDQDKYAKETRKKVPDVDEKEFDSEYLKKILSKSTRSVKLVILDQDKVGGMGNIYANDALFLAKIHPKRKANSITEKEVKLLCKAMKEVIEEGIKYGGSSASDEKYVNVSGMGGKYQNHFKVYERAGKECLKCGAKILKSKIGGRGTYYCNICQK